MALASAALAFFSRALQASRSRRRFCRSRLSFCRGDRDSESAQTQPETPGKLRPTNGQSFLVTQPAGATSTEVWVPCLG